MTDDIPQVTDAARFGAFFEALTGHAPLPYQVRLATGAWPELLRIPTGLGKTAAVVVGWLWRRLAGDGEMPMRLVYCLPMRVLVEQTLILATDWTARAASAFAERHVPLPTVHPLLGGDVDLDWLERPEAPAIIVGTQDMLLSRALLRGYGASPFAWPVHFACLHNDALWVFDEVQLMGPGLVTSAQLEGFRRSFRLGRPSRSLWASATLEPAWLDTIDLRAHRAGFREERLEAEDWEAAVVRRRTGAPKRLARARTRLDSESAKRREEDYLASLAREVAERHRPGKTTLVLLNRVGRAQAVFRLLAKSRVAADLLLVHSRYRPPERRALEAKLRETPGAAGRIVVSTQVVEAGVDLTSEVLLTELAPWSSFVQRAGRCNRYGESTDAEVWWIDLDPELEGAGLPYAPEEIRACRERLEVLTSASPADLPLALSALPLHPVLRRPDLLDLFHTDPDLSGFHVDVSPYIRDADERLVQVFWRGLSGESPAEEEPAPARDELCSASLGEAGRLLDRAPAWSFDRELGRWARARRPRPGQVLLFAAASGGYDPVLGFSADSKAPVEPNQPSPEAEPSAGSDEETFRGAWVPLRDHLRHVADAAGRLSDGAGLTAEERDLLVRAAAWHDLGKAHAVFQEDLVRGLGGADPHRAQLWAKAPRRPRGDEAPPRDPRRRRFRHELASALAWVAHCPEGPHADLIAYLIAAHHGKLRLSLRALPGEPPPEDGRRFARGVWEGDALPSSELGDGSHAPETVLHLDLMELGGGGEGGSWAARCQRLLAELGPFYLAWLEALLRIADWRASAEEAT